MVGEEEKKNRTTAKRKFTRVYNRLVESIQNETEIEVINEKYSTIKLLWDNVQSKHEYYLCAAFPDEEEPRYEREDEWINELEEQFKTI